MRKSECRACGGERDAAGTIEISEGVVHLNGETFALAGGRYCTACLPVDLSAVEYSGHYTGQYVAELALEGDDD